MTADQPGAKRRGAGRRRAPRGWDGALRRVDKAAEVPRGDLLDMNTTILSLCIIGTSALTLLAQEPKPATTTVITTTPVKVTPEVGVSARDGITISGADLMVTRNGATEKLTKVLELPNGVRVEPSGMITTGDGAKVVLRPTQLLTFDGRFLNIPIVESAPAAATTTTTTTTPAPAQVIPVVPVTPAAPENPAAPADAAEIVRAEAERRARATEDAVK